MYVLSFILDLEMSTVNSLSTPQPSGMCVRQNSMKKQHEGKISRQFKTVITVFNICTDLLYHNIFVWSNRKHTKREINTVPSIKCQTAITLLQQLCPLFKIVYLAQAQTSQQLNGDNSVVTALGALLALSLLLLLVLIVVVVVQCVILKRNRNGSECTWHIVRYTWVGKKELVEGDGVHSYWLAIIILPELPLQENVYYNGTTHYPSGAGGATTSSMSLLVANEAEQAVTMLPSRTAPGSQSSNNRIQQVRGMWMTCISMPLSGVMTLCFTTFPVPDLCQPWSRGTVWLLLCAQLSESPHSTAQPFKHCTIQVLVIASTDSEAGP